jgi:hypothetical protein
MATAQAQRTLVKSPPELWSELSDPASLARHLGELGEIRIVRTSPERTVEWEGPDVRGTVEIKSSGWGTRVTLSATLEGEGGDAQDGEARAPQPIAPSPGPPALLAPEPATPGPPALVAREAATPEPAGAERAKPEPPTFGPATPELMAPAPAAHEATAAERCGETHADAEADPPGRRLPGSLRRLGARLRRVVRRGHPTEPAAAAPAAEAPRAGDPPPADGPTPTDGAEADPLAGAPTRGNESDRPDPLAGLQAELEGAIGAQPSALPIGADRGAPPATEPEPRAAMEPEPHTAGGPEPRPLIEDAPHSTAAEDAQRTVEATTEILTAVLDRLGEAHHRPFSRA